MDILSPDLVHKISIVGVGVSAGAACDDAPRRSVLHLPSTSGGVTREAVGFVGRTVLE